MMIDDDKDLRALRDFRGALDEPPDGVLAKGRFRLASTGYRPPRRRRQWLLTSVGAAAAVAAVVGAAAVVSGHGHGNGKGGGPEQAAQLPSTVAASAPGKADQDLPVTIGTRAPVGATVTVDFGATHAKALAAADRLSSAAAGAQPLQIGAGKVLYIKSYDLQAGSGAYVHEVWQDQNLQVPLRIRRTDGTDTNIDAVSTQQEIDSAAAEPASLYRPTAAYLASLPTDPAQLIARWREWSAQTYPGRPADPMIWKDVYELFHYSEPFWTPQQRSAIYHALVQMPATTATTAHVGGVQYDMLCLNGPCLLFESATGRFAGDGDTEKSPLGALTLVDFATQPRPAPAPASSRAPKPAASGPIPTEKGVTTGQPRK